MPPIKGKLVNRGASGLLTKVERETPNVVTQTAQTISGVNGAGINRIAPGLSQLVEDITTLVLDPNNARLHPERNMEAIKQSLALYGQVKPIVARKQCRTVVAGNGTLTACLEMGWTQIAVSFVEMTDAEAAGYGLADNRTAELAKWDFEVVKRLDALIQESSSSPMVGWSQDELDVLRAGDWTPPPIEEDDDAEGQTEGLVVKFSKEQVIILAPIITLTKEVLGEKTTDSECLVFICQNFVARISDASDQNQQAE